MIDSHCHLTKEFYDNIDEVVKFLIDNNMKAIINVADSLDTSKEVLEYSKKYEGFVFSSIGIHPDKINEYSNNSIDIMDEMIKNNKYYAVGEIGLDYHYDSYDKNKQIKLFNDQIELAIIHDLPIIVHTRDSIGDTLNVLKNHKIKGVIHCFSGSLEMAREFVKIGFYLGIGGVLTFKNSNLYKIIEEIDIKNILLETDSPFLSPEPLRGKKNMPCNVLYVAQRIADIKSMSVDEVIRITSKNASILFDLDIEI